MKIAVYGDLHTEFDPNDNKWVPPRVDADIIIFAGDIGTSPATLHAYAGLVEKRHPRVNRSLYVAGNHEWYGSSIRFGDTGYDKYRNVFQRFQRSTFLEMERAEIGGLTFIGCTLWSNVAESDADEAAALSNDYRRIRIDRAPYRNLRPYDVTARWRRSVRFIGESLASGDPSRTVVITHHPPTRRNILSPYREERLIRAYANELEELIEQRQPTLWVHGHIHQALDHFVGSTHIVCNPRGYNTARGGDLVDGFRPELVLEL